MNRQLLIILDGFGYRADPQYNAIAQAKMPTWNACLKAYPHTYLSASGLDVGLPEGQMGNSEVGHLNMGSGRIVYQDLTRIDAAIQNGDFFENTVLKKAIIDTEKHQGAIHLCGLLSPGGVHSHENQMLALLENCVKHGASRVYLHAFLDGRDTPPQSAQASLEKWEAKANQFKTGHIATMIGRYFAMDRDKRWDRVEIAYDLLTQGHAKRYVSSPVEALALAYQAGETDEFVSATAIASDAKQAVKIENGDTIIFCNFRADRARELSAAFLLPNFDGFTRKKIPNLRHFISLTEYATYLPTEIAYPPQRLDHILGSYLAEKGLHQLRIAETEKYAHVTFFFNGGIEAPFLHEERILIPSPKVSTYDLQPSMSAVAITDRLTEAMQTKQFDFIVCNFANPDMLGHTGQMDATINSLETIDACLKRIIDTAKQAGYEISITADHGNAECMFDEKTQQAHTAHTSEPVPFLYIGRKAKITQQKGILADVAPTLLYLMDLPIPSEMTGKPLLALESA